MCFSWFLFFLCSGGGRFTFDVGVKPAIGFFIILFLGAITKSAQLPFSAWLPAAIAAPTPVSSLVHSSTLVTAGVYVLIRFFYIFRRFTFLALKLFFISTIIIAGVCANFEKDFKKIVAISTLSQLGIMLFILSVGSWLISFLHIIIHAFFKRILFLRTGRQIMEKGGAQDSRVFGGSQFSFGSFIFFVSSCVRLAGFPFFIGFYSKDFIILNSSLGLGIFFYLTFLGGCLFTILYRIRLLKLGYGFWFKGFLNSLNLERILVLGPVSFLFFKRWLLGGLFYWLFLSETVIFFSLLDVLVGLGLLMLGALFYKCLALPYILGVFFIRISFMRWLASRGSSFSLEKYLHYSWETSWFEVVGGRGTFKIVSKFSNLFSLFNQVGLGIILLISFFSVFYFSFYF
jgi:NADH-ubiquinone oxidoreductase chain 5